MLENKKYYPFGASTDTGDDLLARVDNKVRGHLLSDV